MFHVSFLRGGVYLKISKRAEAKTTKPRSLSLTKMDLHSGPVIKHSNGKSPCSIGTTSSKGSFFIAMLVYRSVYDKSTPTWPPRTPQRFYHTKQGGLGPNWNSQFAAKTGDGAMIYSKKGQEHGNFCSSKKNQHNNTKQHQKSH